MKDDRYGMGKTRRSALRTLGVLGVGSTAGCLGGVLGDEETTSSPQSGGSGGGGQQSEATPTATETPEPTPAEPPASGEWAMVQGGPAATGRAGGGPTSESVRWTTELGNAVESGLVLAGDRLYTTAAELLFALSVDDGAVRWKTPVGGEVEHTVAYADGLVVVPTSAGVTAVDAATC
jgi:outer membrane protein assembly factor BamB